MYTYCHNNPIVGIDPSGHSPLSWFKDRVDDWETGIGELQDSGLGGRLFASYSMGVADTIGGQASSVVNAVKHPIVTAKSGISDYVSTIKADPLMLITPYAVGIQLGGGLYDLSKASYNHDFDSVAYQLGGGTVLVAEAGVAHYGGQAMSNGFNAIKAKIPTKLKGSLYNGDLNFGRGKNKIRPDINAQGAHSVFKRDPVTGGITNYRTYAPNPQNPTGFDEILGYDGIGRSHKNPVTGEDLIPHVHDRSVPGEARSPYLYEIPK